MAPGGIFHTSQTHIWVNPGLRNRAATSGTGERRVTKQGVQNKPEHPRSFGVFRVGYKIIDNNRGRGGMRKPDTP